MSQSVYFMGNLFSRNESETRRTIKSNLGETISIGRFMKKHHTQAIHAVDWNRWSVSGRTGEACRQVMDVLWRHTVSSRSQPGVLEKPRSSKIFAATARCSIFRTSTCNEIYAK